MPSREYFLRKVLPALQFADPPGEPDIRNGDDPQRDYRWCKGNRDFQGAPAGKDRAGRRQDGGPADGREPRKADPVFRVVPHAC